MTNFYSHSGKSVYEINIKRDFIAETCLARLERHRKVFLGELSRYDQHFQKALKRSLDET